MSAELLAAILAELRGLRADLRRQRGSADLETAWREEIGASPMTTAAVLALTEDDPHGALADALGRLVDLAAPGRAVSIGRLLGRLAWLEKRPCGGVTQFCLRD